MYDAVFHTVWYRPDESITLFAYRDKGKLRVFEDRLEFEGTQMGTSSLVITHVRRMCLKALGVGIPTDFVKVEYGKEPPYSTAYFADGSWLGWSGAVFGGTDRIFLACRHLVRREDLVASNDCLVGGLRLLSSHARVQEGKSNVGI
jgi:hypothetical protein